MATMRSIITASLRRLGANSANAVPTAEDTDVCLAALNSLIDSMSNELLNIHTISPYRFLLNPLQQTYKLGPEFDVNGDPTGADWIVERPMRIETAVLMVYPAVTTTPDAPSSSNYNSYAFMTLRDGFDGDVGVAGYIGAAPFEVPQTAEQGATGVIGPPPTVDTFLTTIGRDSGFLFAGAGSTLLTTPNVVPMAVGETRTFFDSEYGFAQCYFFFPCIGPAMDLGDSIWVTSQPDLVYSGPITVNVVIGPNSSNGESYTCVMSAGEPYDRTISITRNANVGTRAAPVFSGGTAGTTTIGTTNSTMFYPLALLNYRQYADLTARSIQSTWPTQVYDNAAYPVRDLSFWPVPQNAYAVELWLWEPLATYATLDDELNLPPGYERYLILKLAMEIAPEFGKAVTDTLKATLMEAENVVKTLNQQQVRMNASVAGYAVGGRRPSWMTGAAVPYTIPTQV